MAAGDLAGDGAAAKGDGAVRHFGNGDGEAGVGVLAPTGDLLGLAAAWCWVDVASSLADITRIAELAIVTRSG